MLGICNRFHCFHEFEVMTLHLHVTLSMLALSQVQVGA